jgi:hypothetical protein
MLARLRRDLGDDHKEELAQALVVLLEHGHDLFVGDRLRAFDPDVVVGDPGDVRVAELELAAR